jgi:hypothetical protein
MKIKDISKKRVFYPLLFVILGGIILFNVIHIVSPERERVVAYRIENGWGFRIIREERVVVDQPFIPLLPGKTPFPNKHMALKTGRLVLTRLQQNVVPVIDFKDLKKLGVIK